MVDWSQLMILLSLNINAVMELTLKMSSDIYVTAVSFQFVA